MELIETDADLAVALAESYDYPIAILKVSNSCFLSSRIYKEFQELEAAEPDLKDRLFFLIVQKSREVSDALAFRFGVVHETPQILIIENEDVIYYESHEEIEMFKVKKLLHNGSKRSEESDIFEEN